ncbi:MAG: transcriptional repressor [Burkholderiales bacterium]|nr:transcriptional repressor [Burkholderiales bacterium]
MEFQPITGGTPACADAAPMTREEVAERLRAHGVVPTHQRTEIAHVLFERRAHLSADQILALVNARHAEASKATVYNTLKLFLERKLIRELIVDPAKVFYDPNTAPHHHFYDVVTGELTDIPADAVRIEGLPPLPPGSVADGIDVIIRTRPQEQDGPPPGPAL